MPPRKSNNGTEGGQPSRKAHWLQDRQRAIQGHGSDAKIIRRQSWATITGTTMQDHRQEQRVPGYDDEATPSRSPTSGANRNTMMMSFSATWLSVKCGSPSHRLDHMNTIAVQGAAASKSIPRCRTESV